MQLGWRGLTALAVGTRFLLIYIIAKFLSMTEKATSTYFESRFTTKSMKAGRVFKET